MSNDFEPRWDHLGDTFFSDGFPGSIEPPVRQRYVMHTSNNTRQDPLIPDERMIYANKFQIGIEEARRLFGFDDSTQEERDMGSWQNDAARDLAREILADKTKGELRAKVEAAVAHLQELVADTQCGSTLTFMKTNDKGGHYFYACVKNGDTWYTTAQNPRVLDSDDDLIEWLISLEIWEAPQLELGVSKHAAELSAPIETTAVDS